MKSIKIACILMIASGMLATSCGGSENKADSFEACGENNTCTDTTRVCINSLCLPRCTESSCASDEYCAEIGVCTKYECVTDEQCGNRVCRYHRCTEAGGSNGDAGEGVSCSEKTECRGGLVCSSEGVCIQKCYVPGCPEGFACNNDGLCVAGECTSWQGCTASGMVCDVLSFTCIPECSAGSCGAGRYCDSDDRLCHDGECSEVDVCADPGSVCDLNRHVCIEKCPGDASCGDGLLCDTDGRCVSPCSAGTCKSGKVCDHTSRLCISAECSALDACLASYQVCSEGKCIDRCTMRGASCPDGYFCNENSGICDKKCEAGKCGTGMVCGDEGKCVSGECSLAEPCADTSKICSATYKCVIPSVSDSECYFYKRCDDCETAESCAAAYSCELKDCPSCDEISDERSACLTENFDCLYHGGSKDTCINCDALQESYFACIDERNACYDAEQADCSNISDAAAKAACEQNNRCYTEKRSCLSGIATCEKARKECLSMTKSCPAGMQCNAKNRCVDSATADGLGLGEECDDTVSALQCASDLVCHKGVCREAAYRVDGESCDSSFRDRCEGNILVTCDSSYSSRVLVQNCKTDYVDRDVPSTGTFHGDNFICANRLGETYVTCVESCETEGDTKRICGWDPEDYDVDYSDIYTCRVNQEGKRGFFPTGTELCSATCGYDDPGLCDQ